MRPATPALPAVDQIDSPRLILRDGTVATLRVSTAADREAIRAFFHELSPESRRKRFFTPAMPADTLITRLADNSDPSAALTLIVQRFHPAAADPDVPATRGSRGEDVRPVGDGFVQLREDACPLEERVGARGGVASFLAAPVVGRRHEPQLGQAAVEHGARGHADVLGALRSAQDHGRPAGEARLRSIGPGHVRRSSRRHETTRRPADGRRGRRLC